MLRATAPVVLLAALLTGSASARPDATTGARTAITVYAAASLTDAFPRIAPANRYSFAGSNALAAQIQQGAPADVFASANTSIPFQLYDQGLVEKPVLFTRNQLVMIVPKSNPAAFMAPPLQMRGLQIKSSQPLF